MSKKIAITLGDPGGIGPDICVLMAEKYIKKYHIVITDPDLLIHSAKKLNKKLYINKLKNIDDAPKSGECLVNVLPIKLNKKNKPGYMNPDNASFVIHAIETAARGCLNHDFHSMVTGPISKSILNKGGFKISGHTELLAKLCNSKSIMMLMNDRLKVTLQTIHIPLHKVSKQITKKNIIEKIKIINNDLINKFGLKKPKILVCG
jgi:4-hydroxythreonine-4-phosphate dehydrogenase